MAAKKTKEKKRERTERRFLPQSATPPLVVKVTGALGAAGLGAGVMGQYLRPDAVPYSIYVLAIGALLLGVAIWIGTSGDPALRVGDAGIGIEKGGLRRLPWWGLTSVIWDAGSGDLAVSGNDEAGANLSLKISQKNQSQAVAWIVKEARARVPKICEVSDEGLEAIGKASRDAGTVVKLEPLQVVGRRCADSDKAIAWEPDARVCPRCERVYHKDHVPDTCACGGSLAQFHPRKAAPVEAADDEGSSAASET
jgi:hypothetical protein